MPGNDIFVPVPSATGCGNSTFLTPGQSCEQDFTFDPGSMGDASYYSTIYLVRYDFNAASLFTPYTLPFHGTGVTPSSIATVSPTSVDFGGVVVGSTSPTQVVTLINTGSQVLNLSSIALSGDPVFTQTNTCGATLAANATCTVTLTYTALTAGSHSGSLTFTDDSSTGATQTVTLTSFGVVTSTTLTPGSFDFGTVYVSSSATEVFTLTNTGNYLLALGGYQIAGNGFTATSDCPKSLAAGAWCHYNVTFSPTTAGTYQGSLTFSNDAETGVDYITGMGAVPTATLTPATANFGNVLVGDVGLYYFTLTNTSTIPIRVGSISYSGAQSSIFTTLGGRMNRVAIYGIGNLSILLTGCGAGKFTSAPTPAAAVHAAFGGSVHGGQQPISGAAVGLYIASTGGYAAPLQSILKIPFTRIKTGSSPSLATIAATPAISSS